ncbi:hypothetical protein AAFF_G00276290 [Aldrovandia affinis]|uniref:Uncharacterized protein n=1 Tax=Aldrovandia affinis TaxID=143900 RepID=A0AAD7W1E1_9TELE|nr:hypothetical protein AAFF_G00276290 [Aldrovandia affinis]
MKKIKREELSAGPSETSRLPGAELPSRRVGPASLCAQSERAHTPASRSWPRGRGLLLTHLQKPRSGGGAQVSLEEAGPSPPVPGGMRRAGGLGRAAGNLGHGFELGVERTVRDKIVARRRAPGMNGKLPRTPSEAQRFSAAC